MNKQEADHKDHAEVASALEASGQEFQSALGSFSESQKRALTVMTVIALGFGAYFLRGYLELIALAGVLAYLFRPLYSRIKRKWGSGAVTTLTLLSALAIVIIPLGAILTIAGVQIAQMVTAASSWISKTDMSQLGKDALDVVNDVLGRIPFLNFELTLEKIQSGAAAIATNVGEFALSIAKQSVGGIANSVTSAIIFLFVFTALLSGGEKLVRMVQDLSPMDPEVTKVYFAKIGAMIKGAVGGQLAISLVQGTLGAISIYLAGMRQGFFMFLIFLSILSIIPLGSGVVSIPLGIGMALTGSIPGGIFIVLFHILVVSNVDNVLRPMLVPKDAYLPPALMLLAVFAGLSMFGFLGIVFGPVIMIVIVTTINFYRVVLKGAELSDDFEDEGSPSAKTKGTLWTNLKGFFTRRHKPGQPSPEAAETR